MNILFRHQFLYFGLMFWRAVGRRSSVISLVKEKIGLWPLVDWAERRSQRAFTLSPSWHASVVACPNRPVNIPFVWCDVAREYSFSPSLPYRKLLLRTVSSSRFPILFRPPCQLPTAACRCDLLFSSSPKHMNNWRTTQMVVQKHGNNQRSGSVQWFDLMTDERITKLLWATSPIAMMMRAYKGDDSLKPMQEQRERKAEKRRSSD